jgi:hypothetical protein
MQQGTFVGYIDVLAILPKYWESAVNPAPCNPSMANDFGSK